ncbi:hypothetical protein CUS80_00270 [Enterococcus faecium]|uniref:hypothetical protein n=1 Tax=Enterococcus faecium TaxID=1352 RepID=UPI000CF33655|nr:hypothetical protein [Enterococcus faecium]PQG48407.1 hypothetical protein CUS80_00270 [Enterococcus faecium]
MSLIEQPKLKKELLKGILANKGVKHNEEVRIDGKNVKVSMVSARSEHFGAFEIYVKERPPRLTCETEIELVNPYLLSIPRVNTSDRTDNEGNRIRNVVAFFERSVYADKIVVVEKSKEQGVK